MRARLISYLLPSNSYLPQSRPASSGLSRRVLPRFRLRASDFLRQQKVTKDRFKDPWSLRIPFPSRPVPCLLLNSALRAPTRLSPACCRPRAVEGRSAPNDAAPCVGGHWGVGPLTPIFTPHSPLSIPNSSFLIPNFQKPPTPSAPAPRRRRVSAGGFSSAGSGRNGQRKRGTAASANAQVLSPVMGVLRGRGLWVTAAAQRRRGTHRARTPLSASLPTFSARRK